MMMIGTEIGTQMSKGAATRHSVRYVRYVREK